MVSTLEQFVIGIVLIALVYFLTRMRKPKKDSEFTKLYNDILTSDKYKVKGKFEE